MANIGLRTGELVLPPSAKDKKESVRSIIDNINEIIGDQECIFRGEPKKYTHPCSSKLYRNSLWDKPDEFKNFLDIEQGKFASELERYVHVPLQARHRLAQLQHFGGITNLIDFTEDYNIALFFACRDAVSVNTEDGIVIIKRKADYVEISKDCELSVKKVIFRPVPTNNRVVKQSSIFISTPEGYIDIGKKGEGWILISNYLKEYIMDYLEKHHNITEATVFDDLYGYIKRQKVGS